MRKSFSAALAWMFVPFVVLCGQDATRIVVCTGGETHAMLSIQCCSDGVFSDTIGFYNEVISMDSIRCQKLEESIGNFYTPSDVCSGPTGECRDECSSGLTIRIVRRHVCYSFGTHDLGRAIGGLVQAFIEADISYPIGGEVERMIKTPHFR